MKYQDHYFIWHYDTVVIVKDHYWVLNITDCNPLYNTTNTNANTTNTNANTNKRKGNQMVYFSRLTYNGI